MYHRMRDGLAPSAHAATWFVLWGSGPAARASTNSAVLPDIWKSRRARPAAA